MVLNKQVCYFLQLQVQRKPTKVFHEKTKSADQFPRDITDMIRLRELYFGRLKDSPDGRLRISPTRVLLVIIWSRNLALIRCSESLRNHKRNAAQSAGIMFISVCAAEPDIHALALGAKFRNTKVHAKRRPAVAKQMSNFTNHTKETDYIKMPTATTNGTPLAEGPIAIVSSHQIHFDVVPQGLRLLLRSEDLFQDGENPLTAGGGLVQTGNLLERHNHGRKPVAAWFPPL